MTELYISEIMLDKKKKIDNTRYPFCLGAISDLSCLKLSKRVSFFAGENGTGKSTLIEAIAVNYGFNPEGGSKNFKFSTRNTHSDLYDYIVLIKGIKHPKDGYFMRAESIYNVASEIDIRDSEPSFDPLLCEAYGGKSLHEQSHGESFLSIIQNRFFGNGLYILDEPEAALSPMRQMALLKLINDLENKNSQFIIATHSPILLSYPNAEIFVFSDNGIKSTPYDETEHYLITKQFLNNPDKMLSILLG